MYISVKDGAVHSRQNWFCEEEDCLELVRCVVFVEVGSKFMRIGVLLTREHAPGGYMNQGDSEENADGPNLEGMESVVALNKTCWTLFEAPSAKQAHCLELEGVSKKKGRNGKLNVEGPTVIELVALGERMFSMRREWDVPKIPCTLRSTSFSFRASS